MDNKQHFLTTSVDKALKEDVVKMAKQSRLSQSDIIRQAILAYVKRWQETGILEVRKEEV